MAIRISRPVKPWAQMTHTSSDSASVTGPGGWGVKETTSDLTKPMIEQLMSGVCTRLDGVPELSRFPSDKELQARPRRLAYRPVDGRVTLWHAAEAGNDATGRPGNVFAHVAVEAAGGTATRPIDYWRSPDWLVPFGSQEVAKARIPSSLEPDSTISREAFFELIGDARRLFVLRWLLDSVAWAVRESNNAVLVTETADEAAGWITAFSYLTAPQLAQRISFVTFERAQTLNFAMQQGFHVICVPRVDCERLVDMQEPFLLLDPQWDLDEGEAAEGRPWRLPTGQSIPSTPWQTWVLDLASLDREHALAVLSDTERLGNQFPSGPDALAAVPMHWPLSVAMMIDEQSVIMPREDKIQEILGSTPTELLDLPECTSLLDELISSLDAKRLRKFLATNSDKAALRKLATDRAVARADAMSGRGSDDVMEAARIVSLLLDFGLQPVPEKDADIPPLEPVVERLKLRLGSSELADRHEEIAHFNPLLKRATGDRRPAPEPPQPNHHSPLTISEPAPTARDHGSVGLLADVALADRTVTSRQPSFPDKISRDLARIFEEMSPGTAQTARAVYLVAGLPFGVLPTTDQLATKPFLALACANSLIGPNNRPTLLLEHQEQILALSAESSTAALAVQRGLSDKIQTVLTCLAVLHSLTPDRCRTEPISAETLAVLIKAREQAHLAALVRMFEPGPKSEPEDDSLGWAAHMIVASVQARTLEERSVLTIPTSEGDSLGWAVSRRLAMSAGLPSAKLVAEIDIKMKLIPDEAVPVSYTHLRAHETD